MFIGFYGGQGLLNKQRPCLWLGSKQGHAQMTVLRFSVFFFICVAAATAATAAERMAVKSAVADVRADPSEKGAVLWKVERYYPVIVIEKKGSWYRIKDLDGQQGWMRNSSLDHTLTVVVRVRLANIRSGPGTRFGVIFDAEKGTPFKVLRKEQDWLQIQHNDGDKGWVFHSLVW